MRTRIALIAAFAACIVFSAAAAAAVTSSGRWSKAATGAAGNRHPKKLWSGARLLPLVSPARVRSIEFAIWHNASPAARPSPPPPPPAPVPAPAADPSPQPVVTGSSTDAVSTTTPDWACIRDHESDDNYSENTGNGYSGAYQFLPSTWNEAVSGAGYPQYANGEAYEAPPAVQNASALWLYNVDGWSPWSTRYVCGL